MNTIFGRILAGTAYFCTILVITVCAPETHRGGEPSNKMEIKVEEIRQFIEAYDKAWRNKDTMRLAELQDSNYVYFNSRGSVRDKQYVLDLVGHPSYRVEDMSRTEITSYIHSSIAIVSTRWTATPYYKGARYDDDQRCVLVISKKSGSLRLLSDHCTEIAE